MRSDLAFWANIAAIAGFLVTLVGAGVGIFGYFSYRRRWANKSDALVDYLKRQKRRAKDGEKGQHTATHLIRHVGLTEDEILKISFENKFVERTVGTNKEGKADTLYFEYKE